MIVFVVLAAVLAGLLWTGLWRKVFLLATIRPARMRVSRLGLMVSSPDDIDRVETILQSFARGFNAMITRPTLAASRAYCDDLPTLYRPFAQEGLAMGYTVRSLFRYNPQEFEERIVRPRPGFRYLHYVGLGFWSGMRNHGPARLARITVGLDPLHRFLCYDGYGFKHAFFDYPARGEALQKLDGLDGYARNAAYQGVGRALWFMFMDRPDLLIERGESMDPYANDVAAGVGLATAFVNPDRFGLAQAFARKMPSAWQPHFQLGMCFAMKARSLNDIDQYQRDVDRLDRGTREAIRAAVRECDRIELRVRSEAREDGYEQWRRRVTDWLTEHIEYPLAGAKVVFGGSNIDTAASKVRRDFAGPTRSVKEAKEGEA